MRLDWLVPIQVQHRAKSRSGSWCASKRWNLVASGGRQRLEQGERIGANDLDLPLPGGMVLRLAKGL